MAQIFVDESTNCKIILGPIHASIFVRKSHNCQISAAASQVRISDSTNIHAHIFSDTEPALEACSNIIIGPYNIGYPGLREHFGKANLPLEDGDNKWS